MFFFFNDTATTEIYTLSLHDALPISDFLFGEERTAADGTAAVQLAVSLVCGDGDGRGGVEPRGVQQESGAAAERGDRRGVFPAGARAGAAVFVGSISRWTGHGSKRGP